MTEHKEKINRRKALGAFGLVAGCALFSDSSAANNTKYGDALQAGQNILFFDSLVNAREDKNVKKGDIISTAGYYSAGDGGAATYLVTGKSDGQAVNGGDAVLLENDCVSVLSAVSHVNYSMFGAVGDGENDDGVQIQMAHDYANSHGLPVINMSGEYWIEETRNIAIKTSVQWGQTTFHINERYNTRNPVFLISSYESPIEIELDEAAKNRVIESVRPGIQVIPDLKEFNNCLVIIRDNNDKIGNRSGYGSSRAKEELFFVEENGRIVGDVAWTFTDYTSLTAYPAGNSYLTVDGGSFLVSGEGAPPSDKKIGYLHNGFVISRSRTIVKNQVVGLDHGKADIAMNPRSGFYSMNTVFDVTLENIRLIPWEKDRQGTDRDVHSGTYGIGGNRLLKTTFRNITAEGTSIYWGVFGTNMNKNFFVENCRLNRIDVHFHCWNLIIKDSHIGNKGITVTGGGELIIENTTCDNNRFVNFRKDYGGKWDGNIMIRNCRLRPNYSSETSILYFVADNFNYGYPVGWAKSINVENFVVDYSSVPQCNSNSWLIRTSDFSQNDEGQRFFFPYNLQFKNIFVEGRSKGVRLMKIPDPAGWLLQNPGSYDKIFFVPNSSIHFENIQLEKVTGENEDDYHLEFNVNPDLTYDEFSLYPEIRFVNCPSLAMKLDRSIAQIVAVNCNVNRVTCAGDNSFRGEISFNNCKVIPVITGENTKPFNLQAELGTSFINCVFHMPQKDQKVCSDALPLIDFLNLNRSVSFNHLNSRLGKDVLLYLNAQEIKLSAGFIALLKNHHELEDYLGEKL